MRVQSLSVSLLAINICGVVCHASDDLTIVPSLAFQNKDLMFDQAYSGLLDNKAGFKVHIPIVNASVTTVYKKLYVTLKYEKSVTRTPTSTTETDRSIGDQAESNLIALDGSEVNVGRSDASITVGYNIWKRLNLFVGYLDGETNLTPYPFCANPYNRENPDSDAPPVTPHPQGYPTYFPCTRLNRSFQQFAIKDNFYPEHPEYKQTYAEAGVYFGLSYGFAIKDWGVLSASLAYADMDGSYQDNAYDPGLGDADGNFIRYIYPTNTGEASFVSFDYEGSTTGSSIGLTWTASLSDKYAYFIDLRRQQYSMTGEDKTGSLSGVTLKTTERMTGITFGIQAYF